MYDYQSLEGLGDLVLSFNIMSTGANGVEKRVEITDIPHSNSKNLSVIIGGKETKIGVLDYYPNLDSGCFKAENFVEGIIYYTVDGENVLEELKTEILYFSTDADFLIGCQDGRVVNVIIKIQEEEE